MDKKIKERGIIFNSEMVRSILAGRKTQHRIPINLPVIDINVSCEIAGNELAGEINSGCYSNSKLGKPGDRLWVRETWSSDFANYYPNDNVWYAADDNRRLDIEEVNGVRGIYSPESDVHVPFRWRPSIHMPRWASRITLEITDIRVERLNDISEEGALSEGIDADKLNESQDNYDCIADHNFTGRPTAVSYFSYLWESIYGQDSWQSNPFLWVVEFKRVEAA